MRRRTTFVGILAGTLVLATLALAPTPAQASHVVCGYEVVADLTLTTDLGPCPGDGLLVRTSGVTINLNGHTITGMNTTNETDQEQAGIHIILADDVTVNGRGTIRNFDAGVVIEESDNNVVNGVIAVDNINHSALTGAINPCNFGDGILLFDSNDAEIRRNLLENNGPYDGIAIVGDSDGNVVRDNRAVSNRSLNQLPDGGNGPCGPFGGGGADTPGVGRVDQNIGIRIEGPGADDNVVRRNLVDDNLLDGISVNGYVCNPPPGAPFPPQDPNTGNEILGNVATNNGFAVPDPNNPGQFLVRQDGIAVLRQGPLGTITCAAQDTTIVGNVSVGNARHGVFVSALSDNNTVSRNLVEDNGTDGIQIQGPFTVCLERDENRNCIREEPRDGSEDNLLFNNRGTGNAEHDGHDANPDCDNNLWKGNLFGTVNQPCVAGAGGTGVVPASIAGIAASADDAPDDRGMTGHPNRS